VSGPGVDDFPPFIIATVRTRLVRLLHFMAIGALGESWSGEIVVRSPLVFSGF